MLSLKLKFNPKNKDIHKKRFFLNAMYMNRKYVCIIYTRVCDDLSISTERKKKKKSIQLTLQIKIKLKPFDAQNFLKL